MAVVVAASGCGGDQDSAGDGGQAQEFGSLPGDDDPEELGSLPEDGDARESELEEAQGAEGPAVSLWPHCADYRAVLEAAEAASGDDLREFELAVDAAVSSAEALAADAAAGNEERTAGRRAVEAFAAAGDAARFAAYGETSVGLGTPAYDAAYESALAAAWAEAGTGRVTAEARVAAAESAASEASTLLEQAPIELEEALEAADAAAERASEAETVAYAEAQEASAAILAAADSEAAAMEAIAAIGAAAQGVAYNAARGVAYDDFSDHVDMQAQWSDRAAGHIAGLAGADAAWAVRAALASRLDVLVEQAGLVADLTAAHQAALSAWGEAWPRSEETDWPRRFGGYVHYEGQYNWATEFVFDRQAVYDDAAYRAAARAVRVALADSVPSSESVAAAEAEDAHWADGGTAHRAFVAAQEQIAFARDGQRGRLHPGTDGIASNAYHVAVDILESAAQAEAADIRADAAARAAIDIEADPRVVEARAAVERSEAAVAEAQTAVALAQDALWAAESELAEARYALDAARPTHDRAVRAAWMAVATETGWPR